MESEVVDNVTVVLRSSCERTEKTCYSLLAQQVPKENIFVINESPFTAALAKTFEIGIECRRPWTLCIDADVLPRDGIVNELLTIAEKTENSLFEIQGNVLDKFFGGPKPAGNHLYRTALLPEALECIPHEGVSMRPETYTIKQMASSGFPWLQKEIVVGLHDYEQYYKDIYRKAIVHTRKHWHHLQHLNAFWQRFASEDPDYQVALWGFRTGQIFEGHIELDIHKFPQNISTFLHLQGWEEKKELLPSHVSADDIEHIIDTCTSPQEYLECQRLMHSDSQKEKKHCWIKNFLKHLGKRLEQIGWVLQNWS